MGNGGENKLIGAKAYHVLLSCAILFCYLPIHDSSKPVKITSMFNLLIGPLKFIVNFLNCLALTLTLYRFSCSLLSTTLVCGSDPAHHALT